MSAITKALKSFLRHIARQYRAKRQRLNAEREAHLAFKAPSHPPILVYQMGKVGSSTVYKSLQEANLPNRVLFIHFLSDHLREYRKMHIDAGIFPVPYHLDLGLAVRKRIDTLSQIRCKIISLFRDPIAFEISNLFQNPDLLKADLKTESKVIDPFKAISFLEKGFHRPNVFRYVYNWFDNELKAIFDIDVFEHPFPTDTGWKVYRGTKAEALVLRMEDLSRIGSIVISEFLGLTESIPLVHANVRSAKNEGKAYQLVKTKFKLSRAFCEEVYSSRFVRHFYSKAMVDEFIRKWSRPEQ